MKLDRRTLLVRAIRVLPFVLIGVPAFQVGCSRSGSSCYDPELLSTPERALRDSRGYVDASPHGEARQCSGCQFFRAEEPGDCGQCEILGGPVDARGHCEAWTARTSA